jgi:broad specificity phosphatase PhoE
MLSGLSPDGMPASSVTARKYIPGPELPPVGVTSKRLFLVRHGEVINPGGDRPVYYGAMDVPLSPLGMDEAKAAADYLQNFDLELVVSSPLSRAVYGAEQVLARQPSRSTNNAGVPGGVVIPMEGFRELDRGSWCGLTKDEIGADMMARFDACDESVTPDGGESYPSLKERVLKARDEVLAKVSDGQAAAIVSHLQVTRCMLSDALGIPAEEMAGLKVATASITCIDYNFSTGTQTVRFQSFKPDIGLKTSKDGAN